MPRIAGVDVPNDKRIVVSLTYVYGIGPTLSRRILKEAGIDESVRAGKLSEDELSRLASVIDRGFVIEGQLRRQVQQSIARLRDIGCYRGLRHRRGLPVRGQKTQSNARTRKGPRKTVAGKKGVKEMHRG
jgi:small subunit ribosomal protein S13